MLTTEELTPLLAGLSSVDATERRAAAEALSDGDERVIYPLIKSLHDENAGVQDAAMRSLIAIGGEVTAYMTLPLLREGPFLRNTGRIILRQIGAPSVPLLRPLFADKDDDIRTFALDLIADIGICDYPEEIAKLLEYDQNQNTRSSAARALGILNYSAGSQALVAALRGDEWVAFSALESLANMKDESTVDAIIGLIDNPSETLRYAAIEALGKIGSNRANETLVKRLPLAGDIEKLAIIRSLVQIGMTPDMSEVADLLIDMFASSDWDDRLIALTGLSDLKYKRAIPVILDVAGSLDPSDPTNEERLRAVKDALMKYECAPTLTGILADPTIKFRGKVIACEVIGELRCPEAIPSLIMLMDGDLREVRRAGVLALARMEGDEALSVIKKSVDDRDGRVRSAAITELGAIGDPSSFDHLLKHLEVENYKDVLEDTVRALMRIDEDALYARMPDMALIIREVIARFSGRADVLLSLSRELDEGIRTAALVSLGRVQDDRVVPRLIEALQEPSAEIRKTAVMTLGGLNADIAILAKALPDPDMWVRLYAVKALGDSWNQEAVKYVLPLLGDSEPPVVLATLDALVQLGHEDRAAISVLANHADAEVRERAGQFMERLC